MTTCHYYRTNEDYRHSNHAPVLQFRYMAPRLISQLILLKINQNVLNRSVSCSGTLSLQGRQANVYLFSEILSSKSHSMVVWSGIHIFVLPKRTMREGMVLPPRDLRLGQAESDKQREGITTQEQWGKACNMDAGREHWIPWNWNSRPLWAAM